MKAMELLLDRARAVKTQLKLWNAELDRLRYPAYYRGRLSPEEANLLLYNRLRQGGPVLAGKVRALLEGRANVSIDDIRTMVLPAMRHRVLLNFEGEAEGMATDTILQNVVDTLPADVGVGVG